MSSPPVRLGSTAYTIQLVGSRFCCSAVKNSYVPRTAWGKYIRTTTGSSGVGVRRSNHLVVMTPSIRFSGPSSSGELPPGTVALITPMTAPATLRKIISASAMPLSTATTPNLPRTPVKWNSRVLKARFDTSPIPGGSPGRGGGRGGGGGRMA
eukprot:scaffold193359_cov22-Tisochrysis_lutea.AAC.1